MKIKIGINGMGRIGRMITRSIIENNYKNIEIKHINNRTNSKACSSLLKYDSIHGKFNADIDFDDKLEVIRSRVENKLSSMDAADIKNKIIFEVGAKFYYTDNNGCTTEI